MARFKIISKDGSTIRFEGKPKYVGTYLRPSYLEFSEIASPTPIEWEIGDYIDYPRTGLRYRLYSIPQPTKNARKGSHGKAFTYSTVQFHAATKELEIALFKDVVFADNNIHFSTTPGVDTFEDVYGIANRIQACMDDIFPGKWEIRVADFDPATDSEIIENITTAKSFALTSGTCLDALSKIYALWQEVGWIHTFDSVSGKDIITIGYSSKRIDENTTDAYVYGKGNGLTAIKSRQANKEEFATRLYVYGSERNLPARYYNDKDILNAESVDIHNLMIPLYEWGVTDGKPDARKAYIENADAVAKYGVIPRIHYFDSEEAGADVYPSLERTTIGLVRRVLAEMGETKYSPRLDEYPDDSERVDSVKTVLGLPNDDGVLNRNGDAYDVTRDVTIPESTITKTVIPMAGNYELVSEHVLYQHRIAANFPYGEITAIPSLQCIVSDADFSSVTALITLGDALDVSTLREGKSISVQGKKNADSGNWEIDFAEVTAKFDKTVHDGGFYVMYYVTVTATKNETSEPKTIDISFRSGSLRLNLKEILAKTFSLRLKQLGFDIDERAALGAGKTISMKSGMCQGRNFVISACKYNVTYDAWDLTLIRQQDDTLGMLFPNTSYPINEEDRFVLLDIAMPELYVRVAMERLYSEGQALLSRVSKIRNNYEPIIDAKVMQESGRTIREGMFMQINDEDVIDGKTEYILIDTLNISEGEAAIPTYTVSLKEKKKVSYKGTPSATSSSNVRPATESKETDIDLSGYATKEQVKALEFLKDLFYKTEDGESVGTRYNLFSEKEVSSNGLNAGGGNGGTGSGLISSVLRKDRFGTITSDDINTTFNAFAIDSLHKRIKSLEEAEVEVDLTGYATEAWVLAKNYITSVALSPYLKTADANSTFATLAALNALSNRFDALDDALNDDVSGKINTWNEIVDFLDEYSGSEDLATVLSGMNADIASRLKSSDFDTWENDVYSPLAKRVSTAEGNISTNAKGIADNKTAIATNKSNISANATAITNLGKKVTANEGNIAEILKWFAVDSDGNLYTTYNFYSTKEISANGLSIGSGGSGGGLISQVYGTTAFGTIAAESNSATFNAYAIDSLYKRIVSLEGKATAVSFVPAMTSGKQIGTLSIDGVSTVLYAPAGYAWSEVSGKPTLIESEGVAVDGSPKVNRFGLWQGKGAYWSIGHDSNYVIQAYATANGVYLRSLTGNTDSGWKKILREGDAYSKADADGTFLKLSGGTISNGNFNPLTIKGNSTYSGIGFVRGTNSAGYLVYEGGANWSVTSENWTAAYGLIHSGNIGSQSVASATKLATARTIWGQSFDGSGNVSGNITLGAASIRGYDNRNILESTANDLMIGYGYTTSSLKTTIFGNTIKLNDAVLINSSGNVTIGSSDLASTTSKLYVDGVITSSGASTDIGMKVKGSSYALGFIIGAGNTNRGIYDYTNNSWLLYRTSNTDVLIPQGNVGIGTAAPEHKLEVRGNVAARVSDATPRSFRAENTNGTISLLTSTSRGVYDSTNSRWLIGTNGTNSFLLCGNVGIGTDAPVYKLDVNGSMNVVASGATARHIYVTNSVGKMSLHVAASGKRGLYDSTIDNWMIYTDSTSVYFPSKPLSITHAVTMSSTLSVANALTVATNVQIPINGDRITFSSATGTYTKGILAMNTSNTYLEAPLATDSASGAKPAILIGWRGCSAATGTTMPYPITITSGEIALNGTTAINGTLKNVNNIYPNSAAERYIGTSSNPFKYVYAEWFGAATNSNLAFGANNATHIWVDTYGRVGIGTTSPQSRLDVNGDINLNNRIYTPYVFWGRDEEGLYMTTNSISWHNSSNNYQSGLFGFRYNEIIAHQSITANSGVKVASGQALTFLDASGKEHKLTYDSTAGAFKFDGNILVLGDGQFNAIN